MKKIITQEELNLRSKMSHDKREQIKADFPIGTKERIEKYAESYAKFVRDATLEKLDNMEQKT